MVGAERPPGRKFTHTQAATQTALPAGLDVFVADGAAPAEPEVGIPRPGE